MKSKLLLCSLLLTFAFCLSPCTAQVPQGFNYQAIARNAAGLPITNHAIPVRISIVTALTGGTIILQEEHSSITADQYGLISLVVGTGIKTGGSAVSFSAIDWGAQTLFLKTEVKYPGPDWTDMGTSQIWAVPYSLLAKNIAPQSKLGITGTTSDMEEALFEVKNKSGQTVFAVYNEGIRAYVGNGDAKGKKGGFSVGGYDATKGTTIYDLLTLSTDSARIYFDSKITGKGKKGGFSVGGYDMTKGTSTDYMNVSTDVSGIINPSQNRILWYPLKNAFLTGRVLVENKDSVGENSFASGYESKAKGMYSQALGYQAVARGQYSTSIGFQSVANKDNSFAFGQWAMAKNQESYAFGRGAIAEGFRSFAFGSAGVDSAGTITGVSYAKGDYSFAIGQGSQAMGFSSFAFGIDNIASGNFSQAYGLSTEASGHSSTTFGYKTKATAWVDMAIGVETVASGHHSFAGGYGSKATSFQAFAFGYYTLARGGSSVAMGSNTTARGINSFAIGDSAVANQTWSVAMGRKTLASNYAAMAIGNSTVASGGVSFAGGALSTASADHSFAFGYNALAKGGGSVALGNNTQANGDLSFAMGDSAITVYPWSVALGNRTLAFGYASMAGGMLSKATEHHTFAFGYSTLASGPGSVALGDETKATNADAFTIGYQTHANGWGSAALGYGTIANSYAAVILGRFNDTTGMTNRNWFVSTDPAFEIGNGTSGTDRKNAFTVLQNGNTGISMANPQQKLDIAQGNGRVQTGYSWLTNSDIRYKKNIYTLEGCLEKVMAMRGVSFDLISDNQNVGIGRKNIGFIAQELENVIPEVVVTGSDGYKSVAYDKITAVLTEAIKEQQHEIESAKQENRQLKSEIDELKTLVNSLIASQTAQVNKQ